MRLVLGAGAAALVVAAGAHPSEAAAEISKHPRDVRRPQVVRIEWTGTDPLNVIVERRHGLTWVTEACEETGEVLTEGAREGAWSARWQPTYSSPAGTYRIRIEGTALETSRRGISVFGLASACFPAGFGPGGTGAASG